MNRKVVDKNTAEKADEINNNFLCNKHAKSGNAFMLDFLNRFEVESLVYQNRYCHAHKLSEPCFTHLRALTDSFS